MLRESHLAFLALPHTAPEDLAARISQVLKAHELRPFRADLEPGAVFGASIQNALREAEVVIADITGKDANVLFEVGLAFGLGKPVLLLSQGSLEGLPSDLAAYQVASYRPDELSQVDRYLHLWLRDALRQTSSAY